MKKNKRYFVITFDKDGVRYYLTPFVRINPLSTWPKSAKKFKSLSDAQNGFKWLDKSVRNKAVIREIVEE